MQNIILVGSGGCMREILFQIEELNKQTPTWNVLGFVDEYYDETDANIQRILPRCPFLGKDEILLRSKEERNVIVCVGEPKLRKKIVDKLKYNPNILFPNIVLADTMIANDVFMGEGCIVSQGTTISTGTIMGDFVFLNMNSLICHEGNIGDFVTLSPRVSLAGNVTIGNETELGMCTVVIQGVSIGKNTVIGAGAVVVNDISSDVVAVGVPAKERL